MEDETEVGESLEICTPFGNDSGSIATDHGLRKILSFE